MDPIAVWLHDKPVPETYMRWQLVVLFRNGEVKQIKRDEN